MKKILLIEDEPQLRANVSTILKMESYRVFEASNGVDGVALAEQEKPDLILCDVMMPHMDGWEVLKTLRATGKTAHIPFIFLTSKSQRDDLRAGMTLGADDYLTKPFTIPELLSAITARLKRLSLQNAEKKVQFTSAQELQKLGLTPREAEVLFWVAQGKSNADVGMILEMSLATVKKHVEHIFQKLGVENRSAAIIQALECFTEVRHA
jgi:DNA-binding NarL/FixJ family response regulator